MRDIEKIMEKHGIPGRDLGDLPDSSKTEKYLFVNLIYRSQET